MAAHLHRPFNTPLQDEDFKILARGFWEVGDTDDVDVCRSWLSVWKATDRRLGQQKLADHFIQNFDQMFDLVKLIKWEVAQPSYKLMDWISRADEVLQVHAPDFHLWHLLQGRIDELRRLHRLNAGNENYNHPWPAVDTRITELNNDMELNNDIDLGNDKKTRLFMNSFELVLSIWLMISVGQGGRVGLAGEASYDWPPLAGPEGIGLGEDVSNWQIIWKDLARKGHLYRFKDGDLDRPNLEELGIEMEDEESEFEVKNALGCSLASVQHYLDTSLRRILGAPDPVDAHTFPEYFTLRDLRLMGDFKLRFTDNLLQHLRVMRHRDDSFRPTVYIFQHANVLHKLSESGPTDEFKKLAKEVLMTMALLMPCDQIAWSDISRYQGEKLDSETMIDKTIGDQWMNYPSHRLHQASNYNYWRRRLLLLEEEFHIVGSRSIRAWLFDRRKGRLSFGGSTLTWIALILAYISLLVTSLIGLEANTYAQEANTYAQEANYLAWLANEYASNASTSDANQADTMTTFTTILVTGVTNFISTNVNQINYNQPTPDVGAREAMAVITAEPSL